MPERPSPPQVSVVIPVFDNPEGLASTLASFVASSALAAATTVQVVDDGSSIDSQNRIAQICGEYSNVRVSHTDNRGPAAARNSGVTLATTTHVAFLDANDHPRQGWIEVFSSMAEQNVGVGHCQLAYDDPSISTAHGHVLPGCFVVDRALLESVGGYDEALRFAENSDLIQRLHDAARSKGREIQVSERVLLDVHQVSDPRRYDTARVEAIAHLLSRDARKLASETRRRAQLAGIGAVSAARIGDFSRARQWAWLATRSRPQQLRNWVRLAGVLVPAIGKRRWSSADLFQRVD